MDRVEKMFGRMKASKLYQCGAWQAGYNRQ